MANETIKEIIIENGEDEGEEGEAIVLKIRDGVAINKAVEAIVLLFTIASAISDFENIDSGSEQKPLPF
jgi:hypothetical protein